MTLEEFLVQTQSEVRSMVSDRMVAGTYLKDEAAFSDVVMQHMAECGMTFDPRVLHIERTVSGSKLKLNGYAVSDDADQVDLFVTLYDGVDAVQPIADADVVRAAEQCLKFLGKSADGKLVAAIDPSDDAYEFSLTIKDCYEDLEQIRVYILTDRQAKTRVFKPRDVAGKSVRLEVMDIERLHRHWSEGKPRDELVVSFEEVCGSPLPCVYVPGENEEYDYALTAIPGATLRLLYERYGARLLEANVRSFLSQTGKVNKGIRDTLRDAPERFMAYNNGIVLIADEASLARAADGSMGLAWLKGMQIVNGGQTTASIYFTKRKHPDIDLTRVRVPAKVIVLHSHNPDAEELLISDISRYANSQNAVKVSDLSANKPFHVELEKLALSTYCPDGTSRWFYERAAGSYNVMLAREGTTPARLRQIKEAIPPGRKITKTDLAKYVQAWGRKPQIVSLGNQKNFDRFMSDDDTVTSVIPDVSRYKHAIAQTILFRTAQKIVRTGGFQAYQANITAYTVASLSEIAGSRLSLDAIWQKQGLSSQLSGYISNLAARVNDILRDDAGARQVSEWAKKDECWESLKASSLPPPPADVPEISRSHA
ncbi:AIPR family protein [Pseudaminobacter soli (ex Li et al. 2025)]|uniref:Abortive phage infection protein n=1 Tax=Pseudaminobacter soli (ex Li et al. 2025) TaxID=1295366 RepID=A0A2P7RKW4_9HYPH|nr:AIPR family protein [Mesorhizobium soli]PSJ50795.1 abortive phage infection protein [Mesorhizobium soli]